MGLFFHKEYDEHAEKTFSDAKTVADVLDRVRDLAYKCKPKPDSTTAVEWPPANHTTRDLPPRMDCLIGSFRVEQSPNLVQDAFDNFQATSLATFEHTLSEREKRHFVVLEACRSAQTEHVTRWTKAVDTSIRVDKEIYDDISLMPEHHELSVYFSDPRRILEYQDDGTLPPRLSLVSFGCVYNAVMIAFCHLPHLDVHEEIQEIARLGAQVAAGPLDKTSKIRPANWPDNVPDTPAFRKAKDMLQWAFHTAFEFNTPYVQISDGWYHIWLHILKGVVRVGPTMEPTIYQENPETGPETDGKLSLCKAFLAFKRHAIEHRLNNRFLEIVVLQDADVEMSKTLREGLDGRMRAEEWRAGVERDKAEAQKSAQSAPSEETPVAQPVKNVTVKSQADSQSFSDQQSPNSRDPSPRKSPDDLRVRSLPVAAAARTNGILLDTASSPRSDTGPVYPTAREGRRSHSLLTHHV